MMAPLNKEAYYSPEFYSREQEKIFKKSWLFIGLKTELKNHNDYVALRRIGIPLYIQNINGELKAFRNICSHRRSPIFNENTKGNQKSVCPYHGWVYDANGKPCGIPHKETFENLGKDTIDKLALEKWDVDSCGQLIFIKHSDFQISLKDYLANFYDELREISNSFGKIQEIKETKINCNWKIAVENALEAYHVNRVHAETFVGVLSTELQNGQDIYHLPHSSWETTIEEKILKKMSKLEHLYQFRAYKREGYKHIFIFPNLAIATTRGHNFGIQVYNPLNETQVDFINYVIGPKIQEELSSKETFILNLLLESAAKFNTQVFKEDADICELVQHSTPSATHDSILSQVLEKRVFEFQQQCQQSLKL